MHPIGAYIHFPYCRKKCPYCDFASFEPPEDGIDHSGYADAVLLELEARGEALEHARLESVFFGGGTPSLWEPRELGRVLEAILARARVGRDEVEITIECNPSSLDLHRAVAFAEQGVNRFSVGVQGLDRTRLAHLGRLHDPEGALAAVRAALGTRVGNVAPRVSADLMIGIAPSFDERAHQTPEQAVDEALELAALGLGHLSAYQLTVEANTRFGELHRAGRLPLVREETMAHTFVAVGTALEQAGFEHYEISNYARPGERSVHNVGYWRGHDYLGLGCAAFGTLSPRGEDGTAIRYRNSPNPQKYLEKARLRDFSPHETEELAPETRLKESIMLGLRLVEGVDIEARAAELGVEPWPLDRKRARDRLVGSGRLVHAAGRIAIPRDAWLFADGTAAALF
ncbi:MAG: radical SAM family heme chaperone HemW [Myxococcales bacterium]|nr:radical SAM family heme chaperone HemW [Myxococcales bacterium]